MKMEAVFSSGMLRYTYQITPHQPGGAHFVTLIYEFSFGHHSHKTEFGLLYVKTHVQS